MFRVLNKMFSVGCYYKLPLNSKTKFIAEFNRFLEEFYDKIDCLYFVSDLKIDLLNQDNLVEKYPNILINCAAEQTNDEANRIYERLSTLIDHMICNKNIFLSSEVIPNTITDHYATSVTTKFPTIDHACERNAIVFSTLKLIAA